MRSREARHQARLLLVLRQGRGAGVAEVPHRQCLGGWHRHHLPRLLRHGVAIGSERGLVVPIIRDADKLSFADIEKQIADFGARAKEGKTDVGRTHRRHLHRLQWRRVRLDAFHPIINPPQAAILGIHATKDRAVVENGQIVIRPMNYLAVSYDHRIIDGREAVQFLSTIKEALEFPGRALLDL